MTALRENRYTKHRDGLVTAHPVKANTHIYKGSLVMGEGGYAVPGSDVPGSPYLGVAIEEADNAGGADGHITVRVQSAGCFSFAQDGSIRREHLGLPVAIVDDQTLKLAPNKGKGVICGKVEAMDGGDVWIRTNIAGITEP